MKMLVVFISALLLRHVAGESVDIITVLPYSFNFAFDVVHIGAAFDVAAEHLRQQHSGKLSITVTHLYNSSDRTCEDVASSSVTKIAEYFYSNRKRGTRYAIATTSKSSKT